ncbi:GNAT family N-acetyltransferase [Streptomyces sp. NBC_00690]|uniref:GNAT family N-acetyltransferase n=1 Tax=Streptomyces sp. NBC_00690 TaxID=2975808 RepID=UPI002E28ABE3|nr:GNAT family N-acetyltransferase [Streptomyces sp. NBC_00690]
MTVDVNGLVVRELHEPAEFQEVDRLFTGIWRPGPGAASPIGFELIRALAHAGNYVAGAYDGTRLVGASVAFLAAPPGQALHSHVTGARKGRGIGHALKLHQRAWALDRGLTRITWTFDPLVRRNAYFNLTKLGAVLSSYHQAFYGAIPDSINGGDDSDRVIALWRLDPSHAASATSTGHGDSVPVLPVLIAADDGHPLLLPSPPAADARLVRIDLPPDIEGLRRTDPAAATAWRFAVREALGGLLSEGARVTGFHDRSGYVVDRVPPVYPSAPAAESTVRPDRTHMLESPNR